MTQELYVIYAGVCCLCIFLSSKSNKRWGALISFLFMANSVLLLEAIKDPGPLLGAILADFPTHFYGFINLQMAVLLLAVNAPRILTIICSLGVFAHFFGTLAVVGVIPNYLYVYNELIYVLNLSYMAALVAGTDAFNIGYNWAIRRCRAMLGGVSNTEGLS